MSGALYLVATPIGNLADITYRAVEILKQVDVVLAEDTRHARPLLSHYAIEAKVEAFHEHNERSKLDWVLAQLLSGKDLALISDAGTPLISDPGFPLVRYLREKGIQVLPIPGACAAIAALSASGLPTDQFHFVGFLPAKSSQRVKKCESLKNTSGTMVFYESKHRIKACLEDLLHVFGESHGAVIAKELTKSYEAIVGDTLEDCMAWLASDESLRKGEFVILLQGAQQIEADALDLSRVLVPLLAEVPTKQAVDLAVKITGLRKNEVYQKALDIKESQ